LSQLITGEELQNIIIQKCNFVAYDVEKQKLQKILLKYSMNDKISNETGQKHFTGETDGPVYTG
jgi:hypothetical protein